MNTARDFSAEMTAIWGGNGAHNIFILAEKLSDGSEVFNVRFSGSVLHATDEKAACALADAIFNAVNEYTVDAAEIHHA